ncbi:LysR family transcriptional regulator [Paraburkholderia antibiotica]|uniref:LysR family transcriptional regulator n=1 Tax=Paraburkholderia antibiotica TaxID=2728839 RepID=A0A7X9X5B1_9BURK|nr:LysR family transcriptional regulator [Paraburkholderia antibiotica]NML31727.1 LysR family transcriptional regulator [Paraburkholderia antibiotica]
MQLKTLLKHLDLTTLQLLLSIHQHGTLTHAARREAIAVSAASKRLHELEQALGEPLFLRERSGMTLTLAGEIVLMHAREMISSAQRINAELSERGLREHRTVRVAANLSAIIQFFPDDLNRFMELHPDIQIKLNEMPSSNVLQTIRDGNADLGICTNPDFMDECTHLHPYRRDRLVLIARSTHPLAQRPSVSFVDTLDTDYVGLQSDCWVNRRCQRAASAVGDAFKVRVQVSGFDALCRMVQAGVGVGLVPYEVFRSIGQPLGLVAVTLDDAWAVLELQIAVPRSQPMSVQTAMLLDHLRRTARDEPSGTGDAPCRLPPPAARMLHRHDALRGAAA